MANSVVEHYRDENQYKRAGLRYYDCNCVDGFHFKNTGFDVVIDKVSAMGRDFSFSSVKLSDTGLVNSYLWHLVPSKSSFYCRALWIACCAEKMVCRPHRKCCKTYIRYSYQRVHCGLLRMQSQHGGKQSSTLAYGNILQYV